MASPADSLQRSLSTRPLVDYAAKAKSAPLLMVTTYGDKKEAFGRLYGLALGSFGAIVVSDWKRDRLIFFDKHMKYKTTVGGSGIMARSSGESFSKPSGMASDKEGNIYVADRDHHCVKKFSVLGNLIRKIGSGKVGARNDEMNQPRGLVVSSQDVLYIADGLNHRIQVFRGDRFHFTIGSQGSEPGQFNVPCSVALNSTEDQLFVADNKNNRIQVMSADKGEFIRQIVPSDLRFPHGITLNKDNHLMICNSGKNSVMICQEDGMLVANIEGTLNGEERFGVPGEVRLNATGQIIISSTTGITVL